MKLRKSIAYCYPTSPRAMEAGKPGYFVEQSVLREDNSWSPGYMASPDIFDKKDDPDLIQLFKETEGDICPHYLRHNK